MYLYIRSTVRSIEFFFFFFDIKQNNSAQDQWPISSSRYNPTGKPVKINQHKTLKERMIAANTFINTYGFKLPVLVDGMSNEFQNTFFAWPFRFYIVLNGKLQYKAMPTPEAGYDWNEVTLWLDKFAAGK